MQNLILRVQIIPHLDPLGDSAAMGLALPPSWELSSLISIMSEDLSSLSWVFSFSPPLSFTSSSLSILFVQFNLMAVWIYFCLQNNITFNQDLDNKNEVLLNKYIHFHRCLNHIIEFSHNSNVKIDILFISCGKKSVLILFNVLSEVFGAFCRTNLNLILL